MRTLKTVAESRVRQALDDFLASGLPRAVINRTPTWEPESPEAWARAISRLHDKGLYREVLAEQTERDVVVFTRGNLR